MAGKGGDRTMKTILYLGLILIGVSLLSTSVSATGYSISFFPAYWPCSMVQVTFTGPLVESGYYGDSLLFQYYQYSPTLPSVQNLIFTDGPLTVTSDTVQYWIQSSEYSSINFAYQPYIAVRVTDITVKNGISPGQIFFQLTQVAPEGYQGCAQSSPTPEFPSYAPMILLAMTVCVVALRRRSNEPSQL
jgi:predicted secreted protein with PEFG-CTERM motif